MKCCSHRHLLDTESHWTLHRETSGTVKQLSATHTVSIKFTSHTEPLNPAQGDIRYRTTTVHNTHSQHKIHFTHRATRSWFRDVGTVQQLSPQCNIYFTHTATKPCTRRHQRGTLQQLSHTHTAQRAYKHVERKKKQHFKKEFFIGLDGGFLSLVLGWYPLTIMCRWSLMSYSGGETLVWPRQPT